jgi:hypothetical protein
MPKNIHNKYAIKAALHLNIVSDFDNALYSSESGAYIVDASTESVDSVTFAKICRHVRKGFCNTSDEDGSSGYWDGLTRAEAKRIVKSLRQVRVVVYDPETVDPVRHALETLLARAESGLDQSPDHDGLQNCAALALARGVLGR